MFVRFACGCVGLDQQNVDGRSVIIEPCDGEYDPPGQLSWGLRDMHGETSTQLLDEEVESLNKRLALRLSLADRFDAIKRAFSD